MSSKAFTAKLFRWLHQVNADCGLPPNSTKVAIALIADFNEAEGGMAWGGLQRIADRACLAKGTVFNIVRRLQERGHLRIEWGKPGKGHSNHYWMVEKDPHQGDLFDAAKRSTQDDLLQPAKRSILDPPKGQLSGSKRSISEPKRSIAVEQTLRDPSKIHRGKKRASHARATTPDFATPHDDEKKAGREQERTPAKARAVPAEGFQEFWRVYPRQINQDDARAAFAKAIAGGADADTIIARAKIYAVERTAAINGGDGPQWTLYPANWLKKRKWTDPPPDGLVIDEAGEIVAVEQPPPRRDQRGFAEIGEELAQQIEANGNRWPGQSEEDYEWQRRRKTLSDDLIRQINEDARKLRAEGRL
jgi:hypothetical protein